VGVGVADIVITMGCGDACPVYPGKRYLDWDLPDPAGFSIEQVRPIRDEIRVRVRALINEVAGAGRTDQGGGSASRFPHDLAD
jgi:arsenate reductase (thioredoxin)